MAKKKGVIGRLERPGQWQDTLRRLLMASYWRDPQFMAELGSLVTQHKKLLDSERRRLSRNAFRPAAGLPLPTTRERESLARPFLDDLAALASRWGLLGDWAVPILRQCAMQFSLKPGGNIGSPLLFFPGIGGSLPLPEEWFVRRIHMDVSYDLREDWETWVERVLEPEARRQRDEALDGLSKVGIRKQDTKHALDDHVRWLYHRIALKKVPRQIALEESVGQDAVEKAIYQLARALSLRLPRNRGASVRR
jgi:hypothetical protein